MNKNTLNAGIEHLLLNDKQLSTIIKKFGKCNISTHRNYLKELLSAIIGQQLSLKSASKISERFFSVFGEKPDPKKILSTEDLELRKLGLSNAKVKYVKDLSSKIIDNSLSLHRINLKTDDEIIAELTKVKGIGIWTAHMFLIFSLGRLNILATSDLGIKKGIMKIYNLDKLPTSEEIEEISIKNNWNPFNTLACIYIWKFLDN